MELFVSELNSTRTRKVIKLLKLQRMLVEPANGGRIARILLKLSLNPSISGSKRTSNIQRRSRAKAPTSWRQIRMKGYPNISETICR